MNRFLRSFNKIGGFGVRRYHGNQENSSKLFPMICGGLIVIIFSKITRDIS